LKSAKMSNRLAKETSPYLLQHASNPVDWYPWGEEALTRARTEDKPILLSIGYSACHWCHVMAHECFENNEIARLMNENFVNIKVDREERPDLDAVYMEAVQAITGSGGWPLTVFLTPKGQPFFGGTYFPPQDRHGIPGFPKVLRTVADAYQNRRSEIETAVRQIVTALTATTKSSVVKESLVADTVEQAYRGLRRGFDKDNGGFGRAPKFPQPMTIEFLLRYLHRSQDTGALEMINLTLEKMAKGGIYDQLGGGFHRYATDSSWLVPHFEKMLYDNALLSRLYLHAYLVTGKQLFRSIAEETLDYVLREMTSTNGGFYSAQDADSEGVEGKYYVWTLEEIINVLGEKDGRVISDYFGVTTQGNFDGQNILHVVRDLEPEASSTIKKAKASLLKRREQRIKPNRDEKILASWNGLMLASLAEAACILGRDDYLAAAVANGLFLLNSMISDGYLKHAYHDDQAKIDGYLDDYALVIDGLLAMHQATFSGEFLRQALRLGEIMAEQFWDKAKNTFYDTSDRHEDLFVRPRSVYDGALPSGSSAATLVLLKLAKLTDKEHFKQIAVKSLESMQESMRQHPLGFSNWLCALDFYLSTPKEIVIIGPRDDKATVELLQTLYSIWLPNKVVVAYDPADPSLVSELKLFEDRQMIGNKPTVYVCEQYTCQTPVTAPVSLRAQLRSKLKSNLEEG
jgi:uncharacterized protein YyaL (SSP411 family)